MLNYETFLMRETNLIKKQIVLHVLFDIKIKKKKPGHITIFSINDDIYKSTAKGTLQPDESPRYLM